MIDEYQKFAITDKAGKHDLVFEVNYNDTEEVKDCKTLRLTYPDGKKAYISKQELYSMLFIIGSRREQEKIVPQKFRKVRHYMATMWFRLRQDGKKGDVVKAPVNITLPSVEEEVIGELSKDPKIAKKVYEKSKSGIITPSNPSGTNPELIKTLERSKKQTIN